MRAWTRGAPLSPDEGARSPTGILAVFVLLPFSILLLPFEAALRAQAALILAVLVGLAIAAIPRLTERRVLLEATPTVVKLGLALYAGGAVYGCLVGWAMGNPLRYLISQTVALLFLPSAALAFLLHGRLRPSNLYHGLGLGCAIALAILWSSFTLDPRAMWSAWGDFALALPQGAHIRGLTPLLTIMAAAWWLQARRTAAASSLLLAAVALLTSGSRAAWFWACVGIVGLLVAFGDRKLRLVGLGVLLLVPGTALGGFLLADRVGTALKAAPGEPAGPETASEGALPGPGRIDTEGSHVLIISPSRPRDGVRLAELPLPSTARFLEARFVVRGPEEGRALLRFDILDSRESRVLRRHFVLPARGRWTTWQLRTEIPPEGRRLMLKSWSQEGVWEMRELSVRALDSTWEAWLRAYRDRIGSLGGAEEFQDLDRTGTYRAREWQAILRAWGESGWRQRLLGRGLGATFEFAAAGWDEAGVRKIHEEASYIHNFYVFLAFKLGIVGLLPLAGLVLIVAWTVSSTRKRTQRDSSYWFLAGSAVSWLAYLGLSLTSPEIYNFRMAPIWGALLAACLLEAARGSSGPGFEKPRPDHAQHAPEDEGRQ